MEKPMAKTPRLSRTLGLGLLGVAMIFFFNPVVAIVDILPDCIGYLLLALALRRVADLQPYLDEARRGFLRMAGIDALKLVGLLWLVLMTSARERPNAQLLLTFSFSVIELIYCLPAWGHFFDGMFYLVSASGELSRYDCKSRFGRQNHPVRSRFERMKTRTAALFICRAALATLPEMTSLSSFEYSGFVTNNDRDIYEFRGLFVLFAVVVMLVIGIRWLWGALTLTHRLRTDAVLCGGLRQRYVEEVLPRDELFLQRALRMGLRLLALAAVFAMDFYVDEINILPDVVAAAFCIWAILRMRGRMTGWRMPLLFASLWAGTSVVATVLAQLFHTQYYPALVYKNADAYDAYLAMCASTVAEQICFAAAIVALTLMLMRSWHGFAVKGSYSDDTFGADIARQMWTMAGFGLLSAVTGVLYDFLLPSVEFIWLIDAGAGVLFAFCAWKTLSDFGDASIRAIEDGVPHADKEGMEHHD